jgi:hypothetical protein
MGRAGKTILPGRTSGHQEGAGAAVRAQNTSVRRVPAENVLDPSQRAVAAQHDAQLVAPTIPEGNAVTIRLDGYTWKLPTGLALAFGRSRDHDVLYVLGTGRRVWVLVAVPGVGIRELVVDLDLAEQIRQQHFPLKRGR